MKNTTLFLVAAASALATCVPATGAIDLGNIVFVGDSITQGGGENSTSKDKSVSYRYSLWKNFVDNGIAFKPQGSVTQFYDQSSASQTQTPDYRGKTFVNNNEGHYGWDAAWVVSGKTDGRTSPTWKAGGLADWMKTYDNQPKTATVLIGVNDLSRGGSGAPKYSYEQICGNVKNIVSTLQANSSALETVHVFSVLPSAQESWSGRIPREEIKKYNEVLKKSVESGTWNTDSTKVVYHDITTGFDPSKMTSDSLHPKAQGCLIIAGNMARAMGVGQRTAGLERRGADQLVSQVSWTKTAGTPTIKTTIAGTEKSFTMTENGFSVSDAGNLAIKTALAGEHNARLAWSGLSSAQELTLQFSIKMNELNNATNKFGVILGNGAEAGLLYVGENGIYWNDKLLYGSDVNSAYETVSFSKDFNDITVSWVDGNLHDSVASGFYIWLGDQLIGEAEQAISGVAKYKNTLLFGDIGNSFFTDCELSNISFELGKAYAPSAIPEPSMFGLLAGLGALALAGTRRCRRK